MRKTLLIFLSILFVTSLACSLPSRIAQTPTAVPTPTPVPVSPADAHAFQDQLATASAQFAETGTLSLTFNEQQLTAFIADALAKQTDVPVSDPQIKLADNQMYITGKATIGGLSGTVNLVVKPYVDAGLVKATVVSADFGNFPVPQTFLTQITDTINSNLNDFITVQGRQIEINSIEISNGTMTVTGKAR